MSAKLVVFDLDLSKASTEFDKDQEGGPTAFLYIHDEKFWVRLALFAESYMLEEVLSPDLAKFFELCRVLK
jgi:cyclopropane-fatty-acyl-phospholipid synthase